jgi:hypothetical protein
MDKLRQLSIYVEEFRATARQLNSHRYAREWMEAGVPAADAAAWANLGYMPDEAEALIAAGRTPDQVAVTEAAEEAVAGGRDELLRHRLRNLGPQIIIDPDVADRYRLDDRA